MADRSTAAGQPGVQRGFERGVRQFRQDVTSEQVALGDVGVARQDERPDAGTLVGAQLGQDLIGIADDRCAGAAAGPADAGPQRLLDEPVVGRRVAE